MPQVGDAPNAAVKTIVIIFFCAFPIFGYILNAISMKYKFLCVYADMKHPSIDKIFF
jgi:hypothetical protein